MFQEHLTDLALMHIHINKNMDENRVLNDFMQLETCILHLYSITKMTMSPLMNYYGAENTIDINKSGW